MSLFKQFYLLLLSALLIAFGLSNWFLITSSKVFLQKQMLNHAQDTATSVGISLGESISKRDSAQIDTLLNAIFDNGYYAEIRVEDDRGQLLGHKKINWEDVVQTVPEWFQDVVSIQPQKADSEVSFGWKNVGSIDVITHPGYAYGQLWHIAKRSFWAFWGMLLLYLILISLIHKRFARPLKKLVHQAREMAENRYHIIEENPGFSEFKILVDASNKMIEQTGNYIQKLSDDAHHWHQAAYVDPLTQLPNRRDYDRHLLEISHADDDYHVISVAIIKISGLETVNTNQSFQHGDKVLVAISKTLKHQQQNTAGMFIARLDGPEFVCVLRDCPLLENEVIFKKMARNLQSTLDKDSGDCSINMGVVVMQPGLEMKDYLAAADNLLVDAIAEELPVKISIHGDKILAVGKQKLHQLMENAISTKKFRLKNQKIKGPETEQLIGIEHFLQLQIPEYGWVSAGRWVSSLNETELRINTDKLVLEKVLKNPEQQSLHMINVSPEFLLITSKELDWFIQKYNNQLASIPVALEFNQLLVPRISSELVAGIEKLKQNDVMVGVDHFGFHADSIQWLTRVRPDYIKLDAAILATLNENLDYMSYIETLINLAHTLGIKVYATGVESEQLLTMAMQINFDGFQGFIIESE